MRAGAIVHGRATLQQHKNIHNGRDVVRVLRILLLGLYAIAGRNWYTQVVQRFHSVVCTPSRALNAPKRALLACNYGDVHTADIFDQDC